MAKVKCKVCANVVGNVCSIKKIGIKPNKPRICEAYTYDEAKMKPKKEINITRIGYSDMQEAKAKLKAEIKALREALKKGPNQGTAKQLGLLDDESSIILPGDSRFVMPRTDTKHPLTGDLSRFMTTAKDGE